MFFEINYLKRSTGQSASIFRNFSLTDAKNKGDKSVTWEVINKAFGKDKRKRVYPKEVKIGEPPNASISKDPKDVSNVLNKHFTSVASKLAKKLKKPKTKFTKYMGQENKSSMYLRSLTVTEILEEIECICLKKAMGFDDIAPKIVKWAASIFAPILKILFNKCIELGLYPSGMKVGKVTPIHKKGVKDDENNYRPITILTQFNQLFERLLSKRFSDFFDKFNIITKKQFGFLKKHCTEHAIIDLKEYILKNMENQEVMAVLFLDMQKAFDTVSHDILLKKLYHYGVRGNAHRLLSSYLSGRMQFTKIGNSASDLASVLWGVPQGSVLGPLLFLIYINDLPNSCNLASWLFADDTALALSSKNFNDLEKNFNTEIEKVHEWLLANKLSVHYTDKTQYMLIRGPRLADSKVGNSENFKVFMGQHEIEQTNDYKYLGIIMDDKMDWKQQIKKLCSKLSTVCGVLSKVRHYLDRKSLMIIYNSLFDSRLRYGILGWGTACEQELSKIRILQNRAVRFITFSSFTARAAHIYDELEILPLEKQLFLQRAIFMHNLHYKKLPNALSSYCQAVEHAQSTRYRSELNYYVPATTTVRGQKSIKYSGPIAWRDVPKTVKDIAFRKPFTKKMKQHILDDLLEANKNLPVSTFNLNDILNCNSFEDTNFDELQDIFDCTDENITFNGFELSGLDIFSNGNHNSIDSDSIHNLSSILVDENDFLGS